MTEGVWDEQGCPFRHDRPRLAPAAGLYDELVMIVEKPENSAEKLAATKRLADFEASAAVESRAKLIDEHSAAFRWMIASLFALNGGAILAMVGSSQISLQPVFSAFWVFFAGIVTTFLAVFFGQLSDRYMIARMHAWGLYWTTVAATAERNEEYEEKLKAGISEAEKFGRWGRIQAIFAMVFFVFGVLTLVVLQQKAEIAKLEADLKVIEDQVEQ